MGQSVGPLKNSRRGMNLLEIMLALSLLGLLAVSLILILTGGLRLLSFSERTDVAASLAKEMVERIVEREVEPFEGVYDGRPPTPTEQIYGFPPSPYPARTVGNDYRFVVSVASRDERIWHLKVEVYDGVHRASNLEYLLRK